MPNIADGLRETIEHRMRFPNKAYFTTFAEEHDREREKERRYEEKRAGETASAITRTASASES